MEKQPEGEPVPLLLIKSPEQPPPDLVILKGLCAYIGRHYVLPTEGQRPPLVIPVDVVGQAGITSGLNLNGEVSDVEAARKILLNNSILPDLN